MERYINADKLYDYLMHMANDNTDKLNGYLMMMANDNADKLYDFLMTVLDGADVQAFFTEDEIALINEYKEEVKAVDFKTAILNAVSVALDKAYWQNVFANKPTDSAPTADVREVKHCHIVHDKGGWLSCSNCHILLPQLFDVYRFYYCPNCGAIMDEVVE